MPTVENVAAGQYYHRDTGHLSVGDTANVSEDLAAYLCEERIGFERAESDTTDDVCGFEKDDGELCQRDAGWGRDADTGRCKDHHE